MAYAVWPGLPWVAYRYHDQRLVELVRNDGPGAVRPIAMEALARRRYSLPEELSDTDRKTIHAFLLARGWTESPFLFEDPKDAERTGVALEGAVNGSNTVFSLPTSDTDEDYRHFPKQGSVVLKVAGSPVSVASVSTDGRTVTASAAPVSGAVTADFTGLRLVRLVDAPEVAGIQTSWFGYEAEFDEIIREG